MTFDPAGYVLPRQAGDHVWFLDTRMTVKAGGEQTRGAFTFLEWSAPEGFGPPLHIHRDEDEAFHELGRPAERPGLPEPAQPDIPRLLEVADKYGYEIVGPPLDRPTTR